MKEEQVTKAMLRWLMDNCWKIVCFDFPQSGTGRILHPNGNNESKNRKAIIPDIVAVKDGTCVFVENKDRFYYPDYEKQNSLIVGNEYSDSITALLKGYEVDTIYYGIGLPTSKHKKGSIDVASLVDFIVCVDDDFSIRPVYNPKAILFTENDS